MRNTIICIGRQFGSGGHEIALRTGKKLGLEEYNRLMGLISQNLAFGNSNLIKLLETEVKTSYFLRKEDVRRKGEQASEKLIVPTLLLMIVVIGIIVYPALTGI